MKILCVCSQGNKRSVFTRYVLNGTHDALAMGVDVNSAETIRMLTQWADVILLAEPQMKKRIPVKHQKKIDQMFTIGPDNFSISIAGRLKQIVHNKLKELKYV